MSKYHYKEDHAQILSLLDGRLAAIMIITIIIIAGCEKQLHRTVQPAQPTIATARQLALIEDGTEMYSPVSGKLIIKSSQTPAIVYKGRLFMFCCQVDMRKFAANPQQYVDEVIPPNGTSIGDTKTTDTNLAWPVQRRKGRAIKKSTILL